MTWVPLRGGGADLSQQFLLIGEQRTRLTSKERDLLAYLAENPGRTVSREELLVKVWGHRSGASEEPVYGAIKRLRAKIDGDGHRHILSVHGDGYRFEPYLEEEPLPRGTIEPAQALVRPDFVGRAVELDAVRAALSKPHPLVTLVGPGGAGKTRCARELAAMRDALFCDLGGAFTEASLFAMLAASLGVPLEGHSAAEWSQGLRSAIAACPGRLLILDNAEQISADVATLVASWSPRPAPILCTSREPLLIADEVVVQVGPLPNVEAVALLKQRLADPTEDAAPELLSAIVERVDRLPLAIELAAAQARVIGAQALLESLDCSLATLVAGARDAPPRHASLRATVEWSWSFLGERERAVLVLLSIFEGGFRLQAARKVVDATDAAAVLASLCRRSLAVRAGDRFTLFAAVRELAREHAQELALVRARHALYFAVEGERAAALLDGPRHREAVELLHEISAELWSANAHAKEPELRARLALVLDRALGLQLAHAAARRDVLSGARVELEEPMLVCRLLQAEGQIEGSPAELLDRALELATSPEREAEVRLARAEIVLARDPRSAASELESAWNLIGRSGAARLKGRIAARLGESLASLGRVHDATESLRRALALHLEAEDRRGTARTSAALAHLLRLEMGGDTARALLADALAAAEELGEPLARARALVDLGQHLTRTGDHAGAGRALDEARAVYDRVGFLRDGAILHLHVAETLIGVGDLDGALREALTTWTALADDVAASTICEAIGCIQLMRHQLAEGERWLEQGLAIARRRGVERSECTLLGKRGLLQLVRGAPEQAWNDFDEAVRKNEARGSAALAGASLADRAMACFSLGREQDARADLERARAMLHHPHPDSAEGRMLFAAEPLGRAFLALRAGQDPVSVSAATRAALAPVFSGAPASWDVVQRLMAWLVDGMEKGVAGSAR